MTTTRRASGFGVLLAVAAAACWGLGMVVAKAGLDRGVSPWSFALVQLVVSVAALAALSRGHGLRAAATPAAVGSGMIEYAVSATLVVVGMALTSAGNAAIVNAAEPVLIVVAAILLLGERVRWTFLFPLAAMAAGLLVLAVGLAVVHVAGLIDVGLARLVADPSTLALTAAAGLLQHGAAVWLHLAALERMPAAMFAIYLGLVPPFALAGGWLLLGEPVGAAQLAGAALVLLAAFLSTRSKVTETRA